LANQNSEQRQIKITNSARKDEFGKSFTWNLTDSIS
jgi:hypothetical protein